jgi:hypothetical protein
VPPYGTEDERVDLAEHVKFAADGAWFSGTREDSRRLYDAAGGDPERFDDYWGMTQRWWERFSAGTQGKTFHAGRGMLHYLVAGRVPG